MEISRTNKERPRILASADRTLGRQVTAAVKEMILQGELSPGERLNEVELAAQLGTSRAPLREAIQRLASEGLLDTISHKGAYVPTFTAEGLRDMFEVRVVLESLAVRLATERASETELESLKSQLGQVERRLFDEASASYPRDVDFHRQLLALSKNQALVQATLANHQQIQLARSRSGGVRERATTAFQEHCAVVECMLARDAEGAVELLERHLARSLEASVALFAADRKQPDSAAQAATGAA